MTLQRRPLRRPMVQRSRVQACNNQVSHSVNINDSNIGRGGAEGRKVCIWKWWINLTQTGCAWATCDLVSRNGFTNSATKICFDLSIEFYWIVYCLFFTISQVIGYGDRLRK